MPRELGGGGATIPELAEMLRTLAHHCSSTALAFSMHTHQVAIPAWRWSVQKAGRRRAAAEAHRRREDHPAVERRVGLDLGFGTAERVEGGYRITARKVFTSGAPAGDLLMTGAIAQEEGEEPMVLHFGIPMNSPHVRIDPVWKTLGMRGTGSHDVMIDGHVVPDAGVALKRKAGEWHPLFQIIATIAFPLIYAVYLGVAESACAIATGACAQAPRRPPRRCSSSGRMQTELKGAQLAHRMHAGGHAARRLRPRPSTR